MDAVVAALARGSTPEPHSDDGDGDTDDEVAQHTDGASEGEQYDQSSEPFTLSEYQLLHRAVFSPTAGPEELKQLLEKGIDVDCTAHAGRAHSGPNWHHAVPADAQCPSPLQYLSQVTQI